MQENNKTLFEVAKSVGYDSEGRVARLSNGVLEWRLKNIDEVPRRRVEIEGDKVVSDWMIGNSSAKKRTVICVYHPAENVLSCG